MFGISKKIKSGVFALMMSTMSVGALNAESLNDALRWAYENNTDINATRASLRSTLELIEIAKSAKRPQIDFQAVYNAVNYENLLGDRETTDSLSADLTATLLLWDGGQTALAVDSAGAQVRAAQAQLAATEQQILLATVQAYLSVLEKQQNVALQKNNAEVLNKQVQTSNIAFDEGAATLAEVSAAKATAATAIAQIALAEAELISAQQDYKSLTGRAPGNLSEVNAPKIPVSASAVEAEAIRNAPSLLAAVEAERAAMYDFRRAQRNSSATVTAYGIVSHEDSLDGSDPSDSVNVGLQLDIPINTGGENPALERQARAVLEQRAQQTNAARLDAATQAQIAFSQYQNAVSTSSAYTQVVKAQSVANEGAAIEFELGASTILDKLDAEQNLLSARSNLLTAKFNQIVAAYNVLAAMGKMKISNVATGVKVIDPIAVEKIVEPVLSENAQAVERLQDRWGNSSQ